MLAPTAAQADVSSLTFGQRLHRYLMKSVLQHDWTTDLWKRRERDGGEGANKQASSGLLFCRAGEPLRGAPLSKRTCFTKARASGGLGPPEPRAKGLAERGGSASPREETGRDGPGRGVGSSSGGVPSPV